MIRPWHIWSLFALCLTVGLPAMGWLSVKAIQLNRAEAEARAIAELEQEVGLALWRMDTALTPLLAHEAAHPYFVYRPLIDENPENGTSTLPSPLLQQPSEFVLLNFQRDASGRWTSPQCPPHNIEPSRGRAGLSKDQLGKNARLLDELSGACQHVDFLVALPNQPLPEISLTAASDAIQPGVEPQSVFINSNRFELPRDQISTRQADGPPSQATRSANSLNELARIRRSYEFGERNAAMQTFGQQAVRQQRALPSNQKWYAPETSVSEGVSAPLWVGDKLLFARRVSLGGETIVQGCWLDWPALRKWLLQSTEQRLPGADLVAMTAAERQVQRRLLASLPVALTVPAPAATQTLSSPIGLALAAAWIWLILAAIAIAVLLQGVIELSERRARFVSAVTHELRTPLTTFRIYSEMLSQDMVTDPQQRKQYLRTLTIEADRLTHLVENVLAFARLEQGPAAANYETLSVADLLARAQSRLEERAQAADMKLQWAAAPDAAQTPITTNASAVEQILFNLIENSCKYAAGATNRNIHIQTRIDDRRAILRVTDHGPGIPKDVVRRLFRPFHKSSEEAARSAPGVGLGLALCKRLARDLGGDLRLIDSATEGACFQLCLALNPQRTSSTKH